jgi:DNA-binding beta-propeller fold protein YncE
MRIVWTSLLVLFTPVAAVVAAPEGYHLAKTIPVPGDGGWDYLIADGAARRVYVSHGNQVDVLDADSNEVTGAIPNTKGVHGIALAPDLGRGFTSNGRDNNVTIFDLKTLKPIGGPVATGKNPDAILYDPSTKRVFAFNGRDGSATVIDAADGKVAGTIDLGGKPEFAAADGAGNVFVNLEDKNTLVKIDAKKMTVLERWPLTPGEEPSALTIDANTHRLFVGCHNKMMVVVDAETGKVVDHQPIGQGVDAAAFDPATGQVYFSCGDGTVTVIHEDGPNKYSVAETVKTKVGARTMALDPKTHDLFLPSAERKPNAGGGRPTLVPGTFAVLRFSR